MLGMMQSMLQKQIVIAVDTARLEFSGHDPVHHRPLNAIKDLVERVTGDSLYVLAKESKGGFLAVRSWLTLISHPRPLRHFDAACCNLRRVYSTRPPASIRDSINSG